MSLNIKRRTAYRGAGKVDQESMTAAVIIAVRERLERVRREQGLSLVDRLLRLLVIGPPRNFVAGSDIRPAMMQAQLAH